MAWVAVAVGVGSLVAGSMRSDPAAPDYTPVANASTESARIMADLGQNQLDEARRQYDANSAIVRPVVDTQLGIMNQTAWQGADQYNYMTNQQRPVESALNARALADNSASDAAARAGVTTAQTAAANQLLAGADTVRTAADTSANRIESTDNRLAGNLTTGAEGIATGLASGTAGLSRDMTTNTAGVASNLATGVGGVGANLTGGAGTIANDLTSGAGQVGQTLTNTGATVAGGIRDQSAGYEGNIGNDISLYTGGNQGLYDKYGADIEGDVGKAVADARAGQTSAANTAARQALRYGASVPVTTGGVAVSNAQAIAAAANAARTAGIDKVRANLGTGVGMKQNLFQTAGGQTVAAGNIEADTSKAAAGIQSSALENAAATKANALQSASSMQTDALKTGAGLNADAIKTGAGLEASSLSQGANLNANALQAGTALQDSGTRSAIDLSQRGVNDQLALEQAGLNAQTTAASTGRDLAIADTARDTGTKMDVAGLYRGLSGASAGAYSVANNSGNSAVNNQIAPGQSLLTGMNQAANITGAGLNTQMAGLSSMTGAQTSAYNAGLNSSAAEANGTMGALGTVAGAYLARSSKEVKTDKEPISDAGALAGLTKIPVDKWDYKPGVEDGGTHVGPYAEDVQQQFGDQAAPGGKAIDLISMNGITIAALKGLEKKVAVLERKMKKGGNVVEGEYSVVNDSGGKGGGSPVLPHVGLVRMEA